MTHILRRKPLSDQELHDIYASDQTMYPAPLPYERLQSWVTACPDLSLSYSTPLKDTQSLLVVGVAIVLPVRAQYWRDLVVGKLKEIDVDAMTMLSDQAGVELGLHIFHIEKFDSWQQLGDGYDSKLRPFAEYVTADMAKMIEVRGWKVLGFSALAATAAGIKCFKRMNYKPSGYREIFAQTAKSGGKIEMFCVYPGESGPSQELDEADEIVTQSEMMIRYH